MRVTPDLSRAALEIPRAGEKEMLTVTKEGTRTKVRINFSSLDILQTCPRKSLYVLDRKLKSLNEPSATVFGSAIHKALEVFYSYSGKERELPRDFVKHAEMIEFGERPPEQHFLYEAIEKFCELAAPLRALPASDKRSLTGGIWTLTHYFKNYLNDPYVVYSDEHGPCVERKFSIPLFKTPQLEIEYFGTIDVVLKHEHTGVILPADHKTSSVVGSDFYNRLKPNHQYSGYLLGAQQALGLQTDSFLVNCIQVKPKPTTARGTPPNFPRQVTKRSEHDLKEFKEAVWEASLSFIRWQYEESFPLGPVNACANYGGCQFLDVCAAPDSLRENILAAKFSEGGNRAIAQ